MAKKTVAQSRSNETGSPASTLRSAKGRTSAPTAVSPTMAPPAFKYTQTAFDGGEELRPECTAADLFSLVFTAPNGDGDFLANVLRCAADDFEILEAAQYSDHPNETMLSRFCQRANWRLKVALEVAERMRKVGEVQP